MHILVTGATGFLGGRLIEALSADPNTSRITATGRTLKKEAPTHPKIHYRLGDLTDRPFVETLLATSPDIVVHAASLSSPWGRYAVFHQANVVAQQHLLEVCKQAQVKRFIYISTPSIYFNFKDTPGLKETAPVPKRMVNHYATTKWQAEQLLQTAGIPYIILRPRALIGRGDTVIMPRLIRSYQEGKLKIIGTGTNQVDLTSVSNMVQAIQLAISCDAQHSNEAYNISNGSPVALWEAINTVLTAIGYAPVKQKVPYSLLYAIATLMELRARWSPAQPEPVLTRYSAGILAKSFTFDITKAQTRLGYQPLQTTQEAIEEFAQWYRSKER